MITKDEIRLRRVVLKLSQAAFATKLGISREHLTRIETGSVSISTKLEKRYIKLFGKRLLTNILTKGGNTK